MILLNFTHPLTSRHIVRIEELAGQTVKKIVDVKTQFDHEQPFPKQLEDLVSTIGLSSQEWQILPLLVNPPSLSVIAAPLLAELHGRMGYFPPILRLKPQPDSFPPQFEVAEILNLQAIRDAARSKR